MKKKNTTIDDLAVMVQKGFTGNDKRFDSMDKRFDKIEAEIKELRELFAM